MAFNYEVIITLGQYAAFLFVAAAIAGKLTDWLAPDRGWVGSLIHGAGFVAVAVFSIWTSAEIAPGIPFDAGAIMVALAVRHAGYAAGFVVGLAAMLYRIWLGGAGLTGSLVLIGSAVLIGILFEWTRRRELLPYPFRSVWTLGLLLTISLLSVLSIVPGENPSSEPFKGAGLLVCLLYPATAALYDYMITGEKKRQEMERELKRRAYYDALTGLPNRMFLSDKLGRIMERAALRRKSVGLIILDLDHFQTMNDTAGHTFGNGLLVQTASRLSRMLGKNDRLVRLGGDEFAIVRECMDRGEDIGEMANRLKAAFQEPLRFGGRQAVLTVSMGLAIYPDHARTPEELMQFCDMAVYKAKEAGRNTWRMYDKSMSDSLYRRAALEEKLKQAMAWREFELHYMPQIESGTGVIRGVEALVRWRDSDGQLIQPGDFIPLAEETGMIVTLGEWILRTACQAQVNWKQQLGRDVLMSVNISAVQLKARDFANTVRRIVWETGIDPAYLELEITESMLIESMDSVKPVLDRLREIGVQIALDDFGTGYSSLNYLRLLPITQLKIDKSFTNRLEEVEADRTIVESIIDLVHKLNLRVVAEGIETEAQYRILHELQCDFLQGYLFSRPVDEEGIQNLLRVGRLEVPGSQASA
ncbi:putative bifunctional diguanylate cyclase/phosphodiesterase [Paenibacillus thermoaerophilus]|uniref:Bifunctional diguanylate cyclase/phosphodiesterase n=1 Tax=Paenibacillus thermoaerophilus TaxID=1215385 RepID=A0ABW2V5T2_9BACL|nr:EAL domain-containing protein [Paenibacillus thermoaerophilus]TMV13925.1 EAL domain-containing protein [Paenibacillus thermoaerophilus]